MRLWIAAAAALTLATPIYAAVPRQGSTGTADRLLADGAVAVMVTDPPRSYALAKRLEQQTADPVIRARAEWLQGEALSRAGQNGAARRILDRALADVMRLAPDDALRGEILLSQGWIAENDGNIALAFARFQQAFTILRRTSEGRSEAKALQGIAGIYQDAGDNMRALRYYSQASDAYHDDPVFLISIYNNVGESLRLLGRYRAAQDQYLAALRLARAHNSALLQVDILTNLAWARLLSGDLAHASQAARRAFQLAQAPDARDELPAAQAMLAMIAARRGDYRSAAELMDRVFEDVDLQGTALPYLPFHQVAAEIYSKVGQPELAYRHLLAFKRLDDGRRALAASTNSALLAARFDFSNQNLRITQLQANRARLHEVVLVVVLAAAALLSGSMAFGLLSLRRSRNRERVSNAELSRVNGSLEQALRAKSDFLAVTSHEIRTPLNGILGMTQVLLADRGLAIPLRTKLQVIHGAGETMRSLVDDILDLSKMEAGRLVVTRTRVALREMLEGLVCLWRGRAEGKGLVLASSIANCPVFIEEDGDRLRQILMNFLANAVKFTETGTVTLTTEVRAANEGEELVFAVTDTGIGIAEEQRDHIFESFTQADASTSRQYGGTGLGLAISRAVAEALDGRVELDSEVGVGSSFRLVLPLRRLEATAEATIRSDSAAALLLVEPNPLNRRLLAKALTARGTEVVGVETGVAGLAALRDGSFRAMVVQAALPDGEPLALLPALIAAAHGQGIVPIVLVGADDAATADLAGVRLLAKPITAVSLIEALQASGQIADLRDAA